MDTYDKVWITLLFVLAAFVLALECKRNMALRPANILPPRMGRKLLSQANIPDHRHREVPVKDVGFLDVSDAANATNEGATRIQDGSL